MDTKTEILITRHSKKPTENDAASQKYEGISESGVELALQRAQDIAQILEQSEPGTIMLIIGASNVARTKSTGRIYGEELSRIFKDQNEYVVKTAAEIGSRHDLRAQITETSRQNPDKKIVIAYPLFIRQFSDPGNGFADNKGNIIPYYDALEKKHKNDVDVMIREWIETRGKMDGLVGPDPTEVGRNVAENGSRRTQIFVEKSGVKRKIILVFVGQSWSLDAGITYAAKGKVDLQSFEEVTGGHVIDETELAQISISPGSSKVKYRGKEFERKTQIPKV